MTTPFLFRFVLGLALPILALPCFAQESRESGYQKTYTIHADGAWIAPGEVLEPAFVTLRNGVISRVSREAPREQKGVFGLGGSKPALLRVKGVLAAGAVDSWSTLFGARLRDDRHAIPQRRMIDELVLGSSDGSDGAQLAQVMETRNQGVVATYLSFPSGGIQRGIGSTVSFDANDLLYPEGSQYLDIALDASPLDAWQQLEKFRDLFDAAQDWRDSWDIYDEKIEKYEKELEKYEKDFSEYLDKKKKSLETSKEVDGKGDDLKMPKRPKKPVAPRSGSARDDILAAIDGKMGVRLQASTVSGIRAALELQDEYNFSLTLIGARSAHLLAEEIAMAEVSVVLSLDLEDVDFPAESLLNRWTALRDAGVLVALASGDSGLDLVAGGGELVASGASVEDVWAALTENPAKILGLSDKFGSVAAGYSGSLILFEGTSPFDASASFRVHKPR